MFEALIITLREGVEAALVLAIAATILDRRGLERLKPVLVAGAALALLASVGVASFVTRITYDEELAEGIAMLVGAVLVITVVWWMWKAAPHFKHEIESGIDRAAGKAGFGASLGLFLFSFGMVFREGVETAVFLSAAEFNTRGLSMVVGAVIGLGLAVVFGVLFARGTLRIPLKPFFTITSAILLLIAIQLVVGGLHELSEAEVLPSSRAEMALIGPIVKNELLLFTLTVAVAAGWLLFGPRFSAAAPHASATATGPEARLARAARAHERSWRRAIGAVAIVVLAFLLTAFVQGSRTPERAPATPVAMSSDRIDLDAAPLGDGHMHFFETTLSGAPVRFFAIQAGNEIKTCFDACEICGDKGYYEDNGSLVCRNCTAPIVLATLGRTGGCNPIPLRHRLEGGHVVVMGSDLRAGLPLLEGR